MDYTSFLNYPIQIMGIDESFDSELTAIEDFIISDIAYTGDIEDLQSVLPCFVFAAFCENRRSEVSAMTGEQSKVSEFTVPSERAQIAAWNIGVAKLNAILINGETVTEKYTSKITVI